MPVEFRCATLTGRGSLQDVSLCGARVEEVDRRPLVGDRLRLVFGPGSSEYGSWVPAEVVRHTVTGGFAVKFYDLDVRIMGILRRLLPKPTDLSPSQD